MDHDTIPILEEHQYDASAIHFGINDLLKSSKNINVNGISKDISLFLALFAVLKFPTQ